MEKLKKRRNLRMKFRESWHKSYKMNKFTKNLIAPCGMNCGVCKAYLREKNTCPGCRKGSSFVSCQKCIIPPCKIRKGDFCDCEKPCARLKNLDKRYRAKYGMSMIENLEFIKENGIEKLLEAQTAKYISDQGTFCVHDGKRYKREI